MATAKPLFCDDVTGELTEFGASHEVGSPVSYGEVRNFTYLHESSYTFPGDVSPTTIDSSSSRAVLFGQPVRMNGVGYVSKARADHLPLSGVIGLCALYRAGDGEQIAVQSRGVLQGSLKQWASALDTGSNAGLEPGKRYYLDEATIGKLTLTPNTVVGGTIVSIGTAISSTELLIDTFRSRIRLA